MFLSPMRYHTRRHLSWSYTIIRPISRVLINFLAAFQVGSNEQWKESVEPLAEHNDRQMYRRPEFD